MKYLIGALRSTKTDINCINDERKSIKIEMEKLISCIINDIFYIKEELDKLKLKSSKMQKILKVIYTFFNLWI